MSRPSVSVLVPILDEARSLRSTLRAIEGQDYGGPIEVIVIDGGSTDGSRDIAREFDVVLLDNPRRIQAVALNLGIERATGEIIVRVDGRTIVAEDYVASCVEQLDASDASIVGGAMTPIDGRGWQAAIGRALSSPIGAGPARFHVGGPAGWVDTVYLGAFRRADAVRVGGYREVAVNEDAEFAIRMRELGGIRFDPSIRSVYVPRSSPVQVVRQFWRYGWYRAGTVRRHPSSLAPRQLAAPALVLALLTPRRRAVAAIYAGVMAIEGLRHARRGGPSGMLVSLVLPAMHLPWGAGFLIGLVAGRYDSATSRSITSRLRRLASPSP